MPESDSSEGERIPRSVRRMLLFTLMVNPERRYDPPVFALLGTVNDREWMGREPKSCRVVEIKPCFGSAKGTVGYAVNVQYRHPEHDPEGWTVKILDMGGDGPLDGHGKPLPPGSDPVYIERDIYELTDFNAADFGSLMPDMTPPTPAELMRFGIKYPERVVEGN